MRVTTNNVSFSILCIGPCIINLSLYEVHAAELHMNMERIWSNDDGNKLGPRPLGGIACM